MKKVLRHTKMLLDVFLLYYNNKMLLSYEIEACHHVRLYVNLTKNVGLGSRRHNLLHTYYVPGGVMLTLCLCSLVSRTTTCFLQPHRTFH